MALRPAIGVMAKAPWPGLAKTRLIPALGETGAASLARAFISDAGALARSTGVSGYVLVTPPQALDELAVIAGLTALAQREGDLGARIVGAFDVLFALGFAPVLLIGTDSPSLPSDHLTTALALAADRPEVLVLGPTDDGGYWCVGLSSPAPSLFEDIPWSSARVLERTLAAARAANRPVALAPHWYDVDEPADLVRLRGDLARQPEIAPYTRAALALLPA